MAASHPSPFAALDYAELRSRAVRTLRHADGTRADVQLIECGGHHAVLKDYTHSGAGFARLLAPWLVGREVRALAALDGVGEAPGLLRRVNRRAFLMQYLDARPLAEVLGELDRERFIHDVQALIHTLHGRGVAHGDLRNGMNILVTAAHRPVFVDFTSAFCRGGRCNPVAWLLFSLCRRIDRGAVTKLKERYAPHLLSGAERAEIERPGPAEKVARWVSVHGRNLVRRLFSGG